MPRLLAALSLGRMDLFGLVFALDTSGFAGELTQIGDAMAANFTVLHDFDLGDRGGIDGEGALDADARGDLADGEGLGDSSSAALDDNAFEDLVTFLLVFDDADIDLDGVAARERGKVGAKLTGGDFIHEIVVHDMYLLLFQAMVSLWVHA